MILLMICMFDCLESFNYNAHVMTSSNNISDCPSDPPFRPRCIITVQIIMISRQSHDTVQWQDESVWVVAITAAQLGVEFASDIKWQASRRDARVPRAAWKPFSGRTSPWAMVHTEVGPLQSSWPTVLATGMCDGIYIAVQSSNYCLGLLCKTGRPKTSCREMSCHIFQHKIQQVLGKGEG